jgi:ParB-like nuclease domain
MEECSRRGSNQRMRPKRARKPTISNRWFSGNFSLALHRIGVGARSSHFSSVFRAAGDAFWLIQIRGCNAGEGGEDDESAHHRDRAAAHCGAAPVSACSPEQIEQIAAAITEFGLTIPLLIDEDGMILAGQGRVEAARRLGMETSPVIVARGWSETQKAAYGQT